MGGVASEVGAVRAAPGTCQGARTLACQHLAVQRVSATAIPGAAESAIDEEAELTIGLQVWLLVSLGFTYWLRAYWYLSHARVAVWLWTTIAALTANGLQLRHAALTNVLAASLNTLTGIVRDHLKDDLKGLKENMKTLEVDVSVVREHAARDNLTPEHREQVDDLLAQMEGVQRRLQVRYASMREWLKSV